MNMKNIVILFASLTLGAAHAADTAPCNGFKINLKNHTAHQLFIDQVSLSNGTIHSCDPKAIEANESALYTVNGAVEDTVMHGQIIAHMTEAPQKLIRINFDLTNKNITCELNNTAQQGNLSTDFNRVIGGLNLPIKD
ncbi:hypothetical protein [Legionella saoudiensis]|uniref:hypothetical protein n=1 Tax=Legionella saoudiensis TaxID=1750561 RepID=UPI00072FAF7F|nr:hypothetical protein [Legionella saoudiensis]